ncbi:hypothetical protein FKM82_008739 [Ascaphus truei]
MWAACCNWLCLDTQHEDIVQGGRTQACSNPNFNTYPTISEIICRTCGAQLQAPIRRYSCMDCGKNFCSSCITQQSDGLTLCLLCRRVRSTLFLRDELMKLKVKELRDFLSMRDIPTDLCREKEDLVQLVLTQKPPAVQADGTTVPPITEEQTTPSLRLGISSPTTQIFQDVPTTDRNAPSDPENRAYVQMEDHVEEETHSTDSEEVLEPGRRASLSDIGSLDDIDALSVRQLKEILARNFVNYKGCCEKWELMERVTRLYNGQKDLQQMVFNAEDDQGGAGEENLCKVCMDSPIDCVLLECGHMVTCTKCGKRMSECPICRQYVVRAVHVFRS